MQRIDAHQHFWNYNPVRDAWITEDMAVIRNDFLPAGLEAVLRENGIDGCVTVQSDSSEEENAFQLANAEKHDFIKGVVGWVDLQSEKVEERLVYYSSFRKLKGFRHVLQGEPQRDMMLNGKFRNGIGLLNKYGFTYDILIYPDQLGYSRELAALFPDQRFVIDHLAKPAIKLKEIDEWREGIRAFKHCGNVCCKVSGMVTEADWKHWRQEDFRPYLDTIVEVFGVDRVLFGSDWPVCLVAASYSRMLQIVKDYFASFSSSEQERIFGGNAIKFYNL